MEPLVKKVQEATDLTEAQAKSAVTAVMSFVKSKLPEGLADKVDDMFTGEEGEKVEFGGIMDALAGFFGNAKHKADDMMDDAEDKYDEAKDKMEDMMEDASEKAKETFDKIKGMFGGDKK